MRYYDVTIHKRGKLDYDEEYFQREGFTEEEIRNKLERDIRDNIWRYINENDIKVTIE